MPSSSIQLQFLINTLKPYNPSLNETKSKLNLKLLPVFLTQDPNEK